MRVLLASLVAAAAACASASAPTRVHLRAASRAGEAILTVVPDDSLRINARLPPAIELATGGVIRLARGRVSMDSSYFLEPPWEVRPPGVRVRGALRASFCRADESVCRSIMLPVDLPE